MKIKSLLLGSAAALVAVSGARAADAVIIPEPEVVEYVRVCDAAGTGYFYIPGTETCLKIGGYSRFQINHGDADGENDEDIVSPFYDDAHADFFSRGALKVSSWTDSEYGPVATYFEYHMDSDGGSYVDSVYFTIAGLKMGYFGGFLDNGINGETDGNGLNNKFDSIQYTGTAGAVSFGVAIDEIRTAPTDLIYLEGPGLGIGIEGMIGFSAGAIDATVVGFWDTFLEAGGVVGRVSADVGMATLQARATYVQEDALDGPGGYVSASYESEGIKYVVEGSVAVPVGDKLTLTPGVSYGKFWGDDDYWKAGLTADYDLTETLAIKGSVQYLDFDDDWGTSEDYTAWSSFLRFTASF